MQFTLQVLNPVDSDNPVDLPILEVSGDWPQIGAVVAHSLVAGRYPAIRTFHTETDSFDIGGFLLVQDEFIKTVKWCEVVHVTSN